MTSTTGLRDSSVLLLVVLALMCAAFVVTDVRTTRGADQGNSDQIADIPVDALAVTATHSTSPKDLQIPELAKKLNGRRVRITGGMLPTFDETGLTEFVLMPETKHRSIHWNCDFPLSSVILVNLDPDAPEDFLRKPFTLEGRFHLDVQTEDNQILFLYCISGAKVIKRNVRLRNTLTLHWGC